MKKTHKSFFFMSMINNIIPVSIALNPPDEKLVNSPSEQSQNSADEMARSKGQPDKKLENPTSEQSAADRGYAKGAAKMPPGSIDLFNKVFIGEIQG